MEIPQELGNPNDIEFTVENPNTDFCRTEYELDQPYSTRDLIKAVTRALGGINQNQEYLVIVKGSSIGSAESKSQDIGDIVTYITVACGENLQRGMTIIGRKQSR